VTCKNRNDQFVCTVIDELECNMGANEGDGDTGENIIKTVDEQIRHQM